MSSIVFVPPASRSYGGRSPTRQTYDDSHRLVVHYPSPLPKEWRSWMDLSGSAPERRTSTSPYLFLMVELHTVLFSSSLRTQNTSLGHQSKRRSSIWLSDSPWRLLALSATSDYCRGSFGCSALPPRCIPSDDSELETRRIQIYSKMPFCWNSHVASFWVELHGDCVRASDGPRTNPWTGSKLKNAALARSRAWVKFSSHRGNRLPALNSVFLRFAVRSLAAQFSCCVIIA